VAYTRRARVLFLGPPELAATAAESALELGPEWLEPSTAEAPASGWADLVITLDRASHDSLPVLAATTRHKHWNADTRDEVRKRVAGMVGGMRLLARLSED
jgi:hypothetical protein